MRLIHLRWITTSFQNLFVRKLNILWYRSVNEVICHGIPDQRQLQKGDILNIDISVYKYGFHADLNETYLVGEVDEQGKHLVESAYNCLMEAIKICKPGTLYKEVGNVVGKYIEERG